MIYTFNNSVRLHETLFQPTTGMSSIEREPMVYDSSVSFAYENGGTLTRQFLDQLGMIWMARSGRPLFSEPFVVDTRVHMLKPGWLPAIGGWHCDAVPRGTNGQPDLSRLHHGNDLHFTLTIATHEELSRTAFLNRPADVFVLRDSGHVWADTHSEVSEIADPESVIYGPHGTIVEFERDSLHKATKATMDGWRFFARASYRPNVTSTQDKVRRQVQVYIESEGAGW